MDNTNNQVNPHNSQRQQSNRDIGRILQTGITPEQYAQNTRELEAYSRVNAMGLQVYLQRQNQLAEQRRQDELRLIQMAQQLAAGSQQPPQRQLLPRVPPLPHSHQLLPAQHPTTSNSRNSIQQIYNHGQPYNGSNTVNMATQSMRHSHYRSHVVEPSRAAVSSVQQQQQHYPSFNASTSLVNQNIHPQRDTNNRANPTLNTYPQTAQPPKATTLASSQHPSQYPQYSGMALTSSQVIMGQGSSSHTAPTQGVFPHEQVSTLYPTMVKMHGAEKAAAMTKDLIQSWQQKRQIHPGVQAPMYSATTPSTTFASAQSLHTQSQSQILNHNAPNGGAITPTQPHFRGQEWISAPTNSRDGRLAPSHPHLATPSAATSSLRPPTDNSVQGVFQGVVRQDIPISDMSKGETPSHLTTNFASTFPTAPSSQSHSILLDSEEKSTALYTMRGLAASIKRSLNAEQLAASGQQAAPSEADAKKRLTLDEAIDTGDAVQSGPPTDESAIVPTVNPTLDTVETGVDPHPNGGNPPSARSSPFPQVSVYQEPSHDFVPFSTLAGAVSFDPPTGYPPADYHATPPPVATPLESLTNPQQSTDIVSHDRMDIPLLSFTEASFNSLSFSTRIPTPPLSATITPLRDDDSAIEKPSSNPTSPRLDQVEVQPESTSRASKGSLEATVISVGDNFEDQDRICFNARSLPSEHATRPEAQTLHSPKEEMSVFVRRPGLLDSSMEEISGEPLESVRTERYSEDGTRKCLQPNEIPSVVPTSTQPTMMGWTRPAGISASNQLLQPSIKSAGNPTFYIAVPPQPEWVRRVKRREAAKKALTSEETGQRSDREYAENDLASRLCPRHCHWGGCQAVLNSMYTLKQHVRRHQSEVEPIGPAMTVSCQWKQCRMVCEQSSLFLHLSRHIEKDITCIYDDCDERFSRVQDLVEHEKSEHANDEPPLCAIPQRPVLETPVPLPQTLPSYTVTTRPPSKPSISAERHSRLGPWVAELPIVAYSVKLMVSRKVLGMTFGHPVTGSYGDARLTDKALEVVPTLTPLANGNDGEMTAKSELMEQLAEYDLLEEPSVGSARLFDDLNSVEVTRMFRDGVSVSDSDEGEASLQMSDSMAVEALL